MSIGYAMALRTARMTAVEAALDAGSTGALLKLYTGTRPATGSAITSQVLLGTLTCSKPAGTVSNGVITFSAITSDSSADADGTATWGRMSDSTGAFVADVSVGTSGTDIILNTTAIISGGVISVTSGSLTEGNP